ncbi:sulfate adenylyltransferase subunit 1 [Actinoplanes teichomyceticus]|uniref:sulfate adenylyltransferase n=1 Tax=Actinoplanes teichomyceticus TaxID=1867 RepID=A0A561WBL7_ACTTI|nr:GTP-binding protein [Actinoplanes teichomyceticus]TWG21260.1 sulfate adenylyltransferase subunit 1 [Actinoplanes teichomyceticus]GIF16727.1 sulfate adenylyltransferase subunit 1 [Actinoplanes teichomyceticus]
MTTSLLRLATAGSVDDGKSTLVGRLLYDAKSILADQLQAIEQASRSRGQDVDLALLTDGLRAEREQGITIDVAYRYFATDARRFILADTPGHVQYTRNMVTGASTAQAAVILVDARHGVLDQTRRHTAVAALLRIPHVVLAVNKMDLVGFDREVFAEIDTAFRALAEPLGLTDVVTVPVSALRGDNVVEPSAAMPWYSGPTLLGHLEQLDVDEDLSGKPTRMAVQCVLSDGSYAGQVAAGRLRVGQDVLVLPEGRTATVRGIQRLGRECAEAGPGQSVAVHLDTDGPGLRRGDLIVSPEEPPEITARLTATVCHLTERPLRAGQKVQVQHLTRVVDGRVTAIGERLDLTTLDRSSAPEALAVNDIATIDLELDEPITPDPYRFLRTTGAFLLIDPADGATLSAGLAGPAFR